MSAFQVFYEDQIVDRSSWMEVWDNGVREPFTHPSYARLFCDEGDRAVCLSSKHPDGRILLVVILRAVADVSQPVFDIVTPYGYGGAYREGDITPEQEEFFWREYGEWAARENVVAEMMRLDLDRNRRIRYPGSAVKRSDNIVRTLDVTTDEMWSSFEKKVRKNIRKAERLEVTVEEDASGFRIADFMRIYEQTMNRRGAPDEYYFDFTFFETIMSRMEGSWCFFHALTEGSVISTELVLRSSDRIYSYLGGTDSSAYDLRPNDLLKVKIMEWGISQGMKSFILGGGAETGDGIERYKRSFAPSGTLPFYTGQRILQPEIYSHLVSRHKEQFEAVGLDWPVTTYFPEYRLPVRAAE